MGTRLAPSYACLFMSKLEERLLDTHHLKPKVWLRYIDDIFFVWEHGEEKLLKWFEHLNSVHPTIKFTSDYSRNSTNFLDTTVIKDHNNELYTDLYCKPTDSHGYLMYDSAHPPKCKESLPYSQFLRLKRICSREEDYEKHVKQMIKEFGKRGYPRWLLSRALFKCNELKREDLLKPKEIDVTAQSVDPLYMISTFRLKERSLEEITQYNWDILGRSKSTKEMFRRGVSHGYRRPKNLRDSLVRAKTARYIKSKRYIVNRVYTKKKNS